MSFNLAILVGGWCIIVVSIGIPLMPDDARRLSVGLFATCMSFQEK